MGKKFSYAIVILKAYVHVVILSCDSTFRHDKWEFSSLEVNDVASAIFPVIVEEITTGTANSNYTMVIVNIYIVNCYTQSQRTNVQPVREKKTLLNGTKIFLRIYIYHITNEEMCKTSKILDLGWNKLKVAENVLTLGKVAWSCSFAKKLPVKIPKVTQKLPSTISWSNCYHSNRRNSLSIDNTWCLESYCMHNFSFILFRNIHRQILRLKFSFFFHFSRNRREPP